MSYMKLSLNLSSNLKVNLVLLILSVNVLSGCLLTREDIKTAKERKMLKSTVTTIQKQKADDQVKMDEFQNEFRSLNGRLEVAERDMLAYKSRLDEIDSKNNDKKKDKFVAFEEALLKLESHLNTLTLELNSLSQKVADNSRNKARAAKPSAAKKGNYRTATAMFKKGKWKEAIINYNKYRDLNPKGRRYAEATYKIGVSFQELGMKAEAKTLYNEIISRFSKTKEYKKAKYKLKSLK